MRYRIQKKEDENDTMFCVQIWPEPLCFEKTASELITETKFAFTEEGYEQVLAYLNESYETGEWTIG